jgi:hypothetical protein
LDRIPDADAVTDKHNRVVVQLLELMHLLHLVPAFPERMGQFLENIHENTRTYDFRAMQQENLFLFCYGSFSTWCPLSISLFF